MAHNTLKTSRNPGFTLIEIITVVAIIAILAGMLFPVIRSAIEKGKAARTAALVSKIDAALYKYNGDYRDYPRPPAGAGDTLTDNNDLYISLTGRYNPVTDTTSKRYIEFNENETGMVGGKMCLVDGWGYPIIYTHFTDYDTANWPSTQPWRVDRKKFEFQLIGAGAIGPDVDADANFVISNGELDNLSDRQKGKLVKNW